MSKTAAAVASEGAVVEIAKPSSAIWAATASNILWGSTFLATQRTLLTWGPFASTAIRFSVAVFFLGVFLRVRGVQLNLPKSKSEWLWLMLTALTGFGLLYPLQVSGLEYISSGFSAAIMLSSPLFVIAVASLTGEKIHRMKWVALAMGLIGGVWLITQRQETTLLPAITDRQTLKGTIYTAIAALCLGLSAITGKQALKTMMPASLTFWTMLLGLLMVLPFALIETQPASPVTAESWIPMLYLALACSVLAFFLWNYGLRHGNPQHIAGTMHLKTPIAIALGVYLNGEAVSLQMLCAGGVILFGVYLSGRKWS